ncbi:MAG TPA: hypothetical protein PK808_03300, partial [Polymorphobacter sp.]|nr:hypothetical protein [Polymorphobacter sp.]
DAASTGVDTPASIVAASSTAVILFNFIGNSLSLAATRPHNTKTSGQSRWFSGAAFEVLPIGDARHGGDGFNTV